MTDLVIQRHKPGVSQARINARISFRRVNEFPKKGESFPRQKFIEQLLEKSRKSGPSMLVRRQLLDKVFAFES